MSFRSLPLSRLGAGVLVLPLVACGGGGGGGGGGPGAPSASFFETREYDANFGLAAINASSAYAEGATGDGIRVAVIDSGIDIDHSEFDGAISPASVNIISNSTDIDDPDGHGTAVAGVIGARQDDALTHGVAFDATILAIRAADSCDSGCTFSQGDLAAATDYAVSNGARVINYSLGGAAVITPALEDALAEAADAGVILVFAAGNGGGGRPTLPARFASGDLADGQAIAVGAVDADDQIAPFSNRAGSSQGAYLVAPGVDIPAPQRGGGRATFTGTSFSTPHVAGAAALVLEAAPFLSADEVVELLLGSAVDLGEEGVDPVYGHGLLDVGAALAPQGALAVPLGTSADDALVALDMSGLTLGPAFGPGRSWGQAIFLDGYGRPFRLDLDRHVEVSDRSPALQAWLAPVSRVQAVQAPFDATSVLRLSRAEGPASPDRDAMVEADRIEGFAWTTGTIAPGELTVMHDWRLGGAFGLASSEPALAAPWLAPAAVDSPYLAFADRGDGVTLTSQILPGTAVRIGLARAEPSGSELDRGARRVAVAELARSTHGGSSLALQLGSLVEDAGLLDSAGGGAMALAGAKTSFLGLALRLPIPGAAGGGRLQFFGHAHYGLTRASGLDRSLIRDVSTLHSSAFGAGFAYRGLVDDGDRLAVSLAQPIRVHAGTTTVDLPTARTLDGTIERRRESVDLAPGGRELDLQVAYRLVLRPGQDLRLNWLTQIQPGHDPDRRAAHAIAAKWSTRF